MITKAQIDVAKKLLENEEREIQRLSAELEKRKTEAKRKFYRMIKMGDVVLATSRDGFAVRCVMVSWRTTEVINVMDYRGEHIGVYVSDITSVIPSPQ